MRAMAHAPLRSCIIPARLLTVSGDGNHVLPSFGAIALPTELPPPPALTKAAQPREVLVAQAIPRRDAAPARVIATRDASVRALPIVERLKPITRVAPIARTLTIPSSTTKSHASKVPQIVARTADAVVVQVAIPIPRGATKSGPERRIAVAAVAESLKIVTNTDKRAKLLDRIREDTFVSDNESDPRFQLAVTAILRNHNALLFIRLGEFGGFTAPTRGSAMGVRLMGVHEYMNSMFVDTDYACWEQRQDEPLPCLEHWKHGSKLDRALDHGNEVERQLSQIFKHTRDRADGTDSCAVRIAAKLAEVDLRPVIAQLRVGSVELGVATAADIVCAAPDGSLCVIELKCGYAKHVSTGFFRVFRNNRWLEVKATLANRFCLQAGLTRELMLRTFRIPRFRTSFMAMHVTGQNLYLYQPDIDLQHFVEMAMQRPL